MLAAQIESDIVQQVIEIPDLEYDEVQDFIKNILNLDGEWVSDRVHFKAKNTIISPGWRYDRGSEVFISPKPFESWFLGDDLDWHAPEKNILRNPLYGYEIENESSDWFFWNEHRQKWGVKCTEDLIKKEVERTNGLFFISKAANVENYETVYEACPDIKVICNPKAYKYHNTHPDWYPGYEYEIFKENSYGAKYGITPDNPDKNYCYEFYQIIYDGAPYFYITHTNLCDLRVKYPFNGKYRTYLYEYSEELETEHMQQYPFIAARTLTELFRLIIDWDILYHSEDNRENVAVVCHNILASVNMPEHVYKDILCNTEESILMKYRKDGSLHIRKPEDKIEVSDNIINWLVDLYWDFRNLKFHDQLNVVSYNQDHYHK